jgi:hypothetical protein
MGAKRYDDITKLCRKQADVIPNHLNPNVRAFEQEARYRKRKKLKFGGGQACDRSTNWLFGVVK